MRRYFLGVDTGATKSHALIVDETGRALGFGRGGPGNWEGVGWGGTRAVLEAIIGQALAMAGIGLPELTAAGFGLAGYDWPEDREPHAAIIRSLGLTCPFELVNDALLGLLAGASAGWGVVVVAGTGCNCYGRDAQGRIGRVTGGGGRFGEHAGANELVSQAIRAVALAWTQRGPATRLTEAFLEVTGARDPTDLLAGLVRGRYQLPASYARLVFEVAKEDQVACDIIVWAGRELGGLANSVIQQLGLQAMPLEVILSGSLYDGGSALTEAMGQTIHALAPQAQLVRLGTLPVVGAALLAAEQGRVAAAELRPAVVASTPALAGIGRD
ncbi:MAG: N-acetylglucosamine kinase [Candidatus Promineifilaceae bacterium]